MKVKVEFVVDTEDYGEPEFMKEIQKLIMEIDPSAKLIFFRMERIQWAEF